MEENVNKASSWEDVLSNNFNATEQVTEQVEEQVEEQVDFLDEDATLLEQEEASQNEIPPAQLEPTGEVSVEATGEVPELDERKQALIDAILEGKEDLVYDYFQKKNVDYNQYSDIDVIKTKIANDNPNWDSEDIELELESKYGAILFSERINLDEIDKEIYPDEYKEAVKINKEIDKAEKLLRRDAKETRAILEDLKNNITLPTSEKKWTIKDTKQSEEAPAQLSQEEIQQLQQQWIEAVEKSVPEVSEFRFKVGDEDVSYKITEDEQKQMVDKMKTFNAEDYLVQRGWLKEDGSPNVKKIYEDVYILENNEKIFKSGWTQAKEKAKMDLISKDIKNINLDKSPETFDARGSNPYSFGEYVLGL